MCYVLAVYFLNWMHRFTLNLLSHTPCRCAYWRISTSCVGKT